MTNLTIYSRLQALYFFSQIIPIKQTALRQLWTSVQIDVLYEDTNRILLKCGHRLP